MKRLFLLFIFLFIPLISSLQLTVDYPKEIFEGEEFDFTIFLNSSKIIYDTKIDIFSLEQQRISKILNEGEWKSTMYYVRHSIEEESTFKLKVLDYNGVGTITIKIRDSTGKVQSFEGYNISIVKKDSEEQISLPEQEEEKEISTLTKEEGIPLEEEGVFVEETPLETIHLNPKTIKTENSNQNTETKGYSRYLIILFCFILGGLYLIKPRKKKNEWG